MDTLWRIILNIMRLSVSIRWILRPCLAVILNVYWIMWVVRWVFGGPSVPEIGAAQD